MIGRRPEVRFGAWRPGDQRYYCSDYRKLQNATGWRPSTTVDDGLARLREWLAPAQKVARASGGGGEG
jgi:CDP-paratose 2-epimerase